MLWIVITNKLHMKFALLCKRHYTNKDLLTDHFGRLFHLPVQLQEFGHEGIVIAGDLHTGKKEKKQINGVTFYSLPISLFTFYYFMRQSRLLMEEYEPDLLIASGDSYLGYLGLLIAKRLNIPFLFDVYDDYTAFGTNKIPGMKSLFSKALENADLVITAGDSLCDNLKHRSKSIINIENGFDPQLFHPIPIEDVRKNLSISNDEVVIGYFGSLEPDLGIEDLIEAFRILGDKIPKLRLLIAGRDNLKLDYASLGIDYRGFLAQDEIPVLINACDVVVIPYLPSKMKQRCNACKIAEYVACKRPVVATDVADHSNIFATAQQSICEPGNPKSMASAILSQLNSPKIIKNTENLTWNKIAEKLSQSMEKLARNSLNQLKGSSGSCLN